VLRQRRRRRVERLVELPRRRHRGWGEGQLPVAGPSSSPGPAQPPTAVAAAAAAAEVWGKEDGARGDMARAAAARCGSGRVAGLSPGIATASRGGGLRLDVREGEHGGDKGREGGRGWAYPGLVRGMKRRLVNRSRAVCRFLFVPAR
jgi:hypothetical protein